MRKMKKISIVILMFSLNAFANTNTPPKCPSNWFIQEELLFYALPALKELGVPSHEKVIIYLRDLKGQRGAVSLGKNKKGVAIMIDVKYWKQASYVDKHLILWHEIGHDYFNMEHGTNKIMSSKIPLNHYTMKEMFEMKSEFLSTI